MEDGAAAGQTLTDASGEQEVLRAAEDELTRFAAFVDDPLNMREQVGRMLRLIEYHAPIKLRKISLRVAQRVSALPGALQRYILDMRQGRSDQRRLAGLTRPRKADDREVLHCTEQTVA